MSAKRATRTWVLGLAALLALTACNQETPPPADAPAPVATTPTPAAAPTAEPTATQDEADAATAIEPTTEPAAETDTDEAAPQEAAAEVVVDADQNGESAPQSSSSDTAAANNAESADAQSAAAAVVPEGPEPRPGVDYRNIDPPQQLTSEPGKVEIAVVFSYTCIHCARLDPLLPGWEKTLPPQVNFIQVPMAHGAFEPLARAFYAAEAMGVLEQTHHEMFKALAEQQRLGGGKLDDIAKVYASLGVDAEALKATANSFAVNTKIARNQRTVARWGIEGTPSIVVAGKYLVVATGDRGHQGMLQTARWLAQKEIADHAR